MDINQLIADLLEISQKNSISHYKRDRCAEAATALSTLQAENDQLLSDLRRLQTERDALLAANQHLMAEREQLTAERDAAVERLREWEKFDIYLLAHNFLIPEKWRGIQKED